ncbi:MAG: DEAD/DEAH box helicase family protein [Chloroflexi bacterium]|nr:DEAD/DEAH box helicase family protein [Chloroflexota bacterium]MBT4513859.1 DEAD/DEAH box helicase family protein [Chloroflexota bacterium]
MTISAAKTRESDWAGDPAGFVRDELGAQLWESQIEIIEAIRDHVRVAVRSCNGSGKTYVAAHVVLWWLMAFPESMVITTAPTERQVREVLWREIRRAYRGNEELIDGKLTRTALEIGDKHYAYGLSTNESERFQGYHEGNILFIVDEASGMREDIFEAIEGSMTSAGARLLLLGNPTALGGTFYEAFHRRRDLWHTLHISAFDTPNVKSGRIDVPGLVSPQWVKDAALNWGEDSPMYEVRVLGDFPSEGEDSLIALRLIEAAVVRDTPRAPGTPVLRELQGGPVELGVDVARFGNDKSVICARQGGRVLWLEAFSMQDTMATTGRVVAAVARLAPDVVTAVRVDTIGIGAGVVDRLRELGVAGVVAVNVSERARNPEQFMNLRAELFDGLRQRFQEGRIQIPDHPDLVAELSSLRYSFTSSGQIRLESKDVLRSHGIASPDHADALMLAFASTGASRFKAWT